MYELKGRSYGNPSIVPATTEIVSATARLPEPALLDWLADVARISTLAVVLPVREDSRLLRSLDPWVRSRATSGDSMAFYLNTGEFPDHMVRRGCEDGILLVGSSGNLSGRGNNFRYHDVPDSIRAAVHYSIDLGPSPFANDDRLATTIVNLCDFTIRRKGVCYDEIVASYERFARSRSSLPKSLSRTG
jgi:hypothetical protein